MTFPHKMLIHIRSPNTDLFNPNPKEPGFVFVIRGFRAMEVEKTELWELMAFDSMTQVCPSNFKYLGFSFHMQDACWVPGTLSVLFSFLSSKLRIVLPEPI